MYRLHKTCGRLFLASRTTAYLGTLYRAYRYAQAHTCIIIQSHAGGKTERLHTQSEPLCKYLYMQLTVLGENRDVTGGLASCDQKCPKAVNMDPKSFHYIATVCVIAHRIDRYGFGELLQSDIGFGSNRLDIIPLQTVNRCITFKTRMHSQESIRRRLTSVVAGLQIVCDCIPC